MGDSFLSLEETNDGMGLCNAFPLLVWKHQSVPSRFAHNYLKTQMGGNRYPKSARFCAISLLSNEQ